MQLFLLFEKKKLAISIHSGYFVIWASTSLVAP